MSLQVYKCPECGEEVNEVLVEAFVQKTYTIDHQTMTITPKDFSSWVYDDHAFHCPHCHTLNVDSDLRAYIFDDSTIGL